MRFIFILFFLCLCHLVEAQIGLKVTLKAGIRCEGRQGFLPVESGIFYNRTWYTYSGALYVSKIHTSLEWTYREYGRYAFVNVPNFLLVNKGKEYDPNIPVPVPKAGDTIGTYIEHFSHWASLSFNVFPNKWKKHQFLLGAGLVKRKGGLLKYRYLVQQPFGVEALTKIDPIVSQKGILWKSEYIYMPFKYTLISARCNYAYFTKFPHSFYEFILSVGTYIDI
jgi:hypothetical protein